MMLGMQGQYGCLVGYVKGAALIMLSALDVALLLTKVCEEDTALIGCGKRPFWWAVANFGRVRLCKGGWEGWTGGK